jgi:hypothetical protein
MYDAEVCPTLISSVTNAVIKQVIWIASKAISWRLSYRLPRLFIRIS